MKRHFQLNYSAGVRYGFTSFCLMICIWHANRVPDPVLRGQPCRSWIKNVWCLSSLLLLYISITKERSLLSRLGGKMRDPGNEVVPTCGECYLCCTSFCLRLEGIKTLYSNFCMFWLATITRNIPGHSLFSDWSQDGVSFREILRRRNLSNKLSSRKGKYHESDQLQLVGVYSGK